MERFLAPVDRARMDGFADGAARNSFVASRLLALYAVRALGGRDVVHGEGRPPQIAGLPGWWLSLSHAPGLVAVAAAQAPCGVDVEKLRALEDIDAFLEAVVSGPERAMMASARRSNDEVLQFWTAKEACLKALGQGLAVEPSAITMHAGDRDKPAGWGRAGVLEGIVAPLDCPGGYVGSLAIEADAIAIEPCRPGWEAVSSL